MVDLKGQYEKIKPQIDLAIAEVLQQSNFINGHQVKTFAQNLADYVKVKHVIPCANGTDALQIALMALDIKPGSEIILPVFTYVATAEVIGLLGLKPVFVDVEADTFNIDLSQIEAKITPNTAAVVPVHLFGQCADMEMLLALGEKYNIAVIEDAAQAIGASYTFKNGAVKQAGTIGTIGTTSFFPSKNLGCYGDGGALFTNNHELAIKIQTIANHGQKKKYYHEIIGVNSRLDTLQAAILNQKLNYLDTYVANRKKAAAFYDTALASIKYLSLPFRNNFSDHVFHQYTLKVLNGKRDLLKEYLAQHGIPTMVYYPVPLHQQNAYKAYNNKNESFPVSEELCRQVISLPMHTELTIEQLEYITSVIISFFELQVI